MLGNFFAGIAVKSGRVARHDGERGDVSGDHAAGGGHGIRSNGYARGDKTGRGNPGAVRDGDGRGDQIESRSLEIMRAGAEKSPLRKAAVESDAHWREVEKNDFLTEPGVIADFEFPGEGDVDPGADHDTAADPGPKCP